MIEGITLHQLQCFDAVVVEGGFQPAAEKLRRAQPTVFAAVKNLEMQLGLTLLDRSGYRVALTAVGRSFHDRARVFLNEFRDLQNHARQLSMGEESELTCRNRRSMSGARGARSAAVFLRSPSGYPAASPCRGHRRSVGAAL